MRRVWAGGAVAVLVALGAAWFWSSGAPAAVPGIAVAPPTLVEVAGLTVHVAGAVADPGLVEVPQGARVADAVAAAGGTLRTADVAALNLAAPVRDGEQIHVPEHIAAGEPGGRTDDGRVRINTADAAELEELPGVGPVLAGRIVAFREQAGPFATVEDLLDVPGIGEATLAGLRDVVVVP
jgi:competence protein ComEA